MTVHMSVMISTEEIQAKVKELGARINAHYANSDKELVLISLLRTVLSFLWRIYVVQSANHMNSIL